MRDNQTDALIKLALWLTVVILLMAFAIWFVVPLLIVYGCYALYKHFKKKPKFTTDQLQQQVVTYPSARECATHFWKQFPVDDTERGLCEPVRLALEQAACSLYESENLNAQPPRIKPPVHAKKPATATNCC